MLVKERRVGYHSVAKVIRKLESPGTDPKIRRQWLFEFNELVDITDGGLRLDFITPKAAELLRGRLQS